MNKNLTEYISNISQKIDWLVTTCSSPYPNLHARESAREHLYQSLKDILSEVYEVGFVAGKKEAAFDQDQKLRVTKFKIESKLRKEIKKEILDLVFKEYGLKDEKIKSKLIKKVNANEDDVEEEN